MGKQLIMKRRYLNVSSLGLQLQVNFYTDLTLRVYWTMETSNLFQYLSQSYWPLISYEARLKSFPNLILPMIALNAFMSPSVSFTIIRRVWDTYL